MPKRPLADEVIDPEEERQQASDQLGKLQAVSDMFRTEGWRLFAASLEERKTRSLTALAGDRIDSMDKVWKVRGELEVLDFMLRFPETVEVSISQLLEALAEMEPEEEEAHA